MQSGRQSRLGSGNAAERRGTHILYLRPLDPSVDETMHSILDAVQKIGAKRLVIDSLAGFEMALAPGFRADFRDIALPHDLRFDGNWGYDFKYG